MFGRGKKNEDLSLDPSKDKEVALLERGGLPETPRGAQERGHGRVPVDEDGDVSPAPSQGKEKKSKFFNARGDKDKQKDKHTDTDVKVEVEQEDPNVKSPPKAELVKQGSKSKLNLKKKKADTPTAVTESDSENSESSYHKKKRNQRNRKKKVEYREREVPRESIHPLGHPNDSNQGARLLRFFFWLSDPHHTYGMLARAVGPEKARDRLLRVWSTESVLAGLLFSLSFDWVMNPPCGGLIEICTSIENIVYNVFIVLTTLFACLSFVVDLTFMIQVNLLPYDDDFLWFVSVYGSYLQLGGKLLQLSLTTGLISLIARQFIVYIYFGFIGVVIAILLVITTQIFKKRISSNVRAKLKRKIDTFFK